jgi:hypothetical protein
MFTLTIIVLFMILALPIWLITKMPDAISWLVLRRSKSEPPKVSKPQTSEFVPLAPLRRRTEFTEVDGKKYNKFGDVVPETEEEYTALREELSQEFNRSTGQPMRDIENIHKKIDWLRTYWESQKQQNKEE